MRDWLKMWRSILRQLWQDRRRTIARVHKDKRQRTAALVIIGIVAYVVFYAGYFIRNPGAAALLLVGVSVAAWIRRRHRRDDANFPTLIAAPVSPPLAAVSAVVLQADAIRILSLWVLYVRALSELAIQHRAKNLPNEIATRSVLLARMRDINLLESLESQDRDLHYLPDGSWPEAITIATVARGTELEALLWSAGEVEALTALEDLDRVRTVDVPGPERLCTPEAFVWREQNEVRTESYESYCAWLRAFAEMRRRAFDDSLLQNTELIQASARITTDAGDESRDLVLGTTLITACSDERLRVAFEQFGMRTFALRSLLHEEKEELEVKHVPK